ncbi:hypothetical protein, partial [Staphylococcus aureus]|uniref:hypothetical protein n=1 Tax=Staphylococcus aureus TaxID=1280 RepID=UPI001C92C163
PIQLQNQEVITTIIPVKHLQTQHNFLLFPTKPPLLKPSPLTNFSTINTNPNIPISFTEDHELIPVPLTTPQEHIL